MTAGIMIDAALLLLLVALLAVAIRTGDMDHEAH